jgi:hypothetical protein
MSRCLVMAIILIISFVFLLLIVNNRILCRQGSEEGTNNMLVAPKYYLVVGAVFKNEAHILDEWVKHYRAHNVDHIYLINDGSDDHFEEVLKPFVDEGYVTLLHQTDKIDTFPRQKKVYEKLLRPYLSESRWWAILDLDEFLYSPKQTNLREAVKKYDNGKNTQLFVKWMMFGSSGHIQQPDLVVPNFLWRASKTSTQGKCIVRGDKVMEFDVHTHSMRKGGNTVFADERDMIVNHYIIQSWKFFERVKMTRGDVNLYAQKVGVVRDATYFKNNDFHDIIDDRLAIQNQMLEL